MNIGQLFDNANLAGFKEWENRNRFCLRLSVEFDSRYAVCGVVG